MYAHPVMLVAVRLDGFKLDGLNLEVEWAKPPPKKDRYNYESENRYVERRYNG